MPNATRWVGLDVHASQTACAIFDSETGEVITRRVLGRPHEVMGVLLELERPVRAVYEAGPTGYGLARRARAAGIDMQVCAPGMIARSPTERIKTDKRDAMKLARLHAAGQLVCVHVPSVEHERLRDLARCREDARQDLMRAKHRIGKFLLRRELYYPGRGRAWTKGHRAWLASLRFADAASEATFCDYLHAHDTLAARRDELDRTIDTLARECSWAETIARLRCLHGIDTLGAFGLCGEICDFQRFTRPTALSAYLGVVPSENSSGDKPQGSITRPARHSRVGCSSRPATTTAAHPASAARCSPARTAPRPGSLTSPGAPSAGCTVAGSACAASAASTTGSPRSPSPANSRTSAGSWLPPTDPSHSPRRLSRRRAPGAAAQAVRD